MSHHYQASAALLLSLLCSNVVAENQQILRTEQTKVKHKTQLKILYSADNAHLTGLGLRIHWNSDQLKLVELSPILKDSLLSVGKPQLDIHNYDHDLETNWFISLAWMDLAANWPGTSDELVLVTSSFKTLKKFSGQSSVRFSASSQPANFVLNAPAVMITD